MHKKLINLKDSNFPHHPRSLADGKTPSYFEWCREDKIVSNSCFISDYHLTEVQKCSNPRKIGWLMEPRAVYSQSYDFVDKNNKEFDYILTYDKELLSSGRNFLFYPFGVCWIKDFSEPVKTKMCSIIASDKRNTPGHQFRHKVIDKFKYIHHYGSNSLNQVEKKEEALKEYRFSIVIENAQYDYFFTEKLIDCIATKTIPIYWGCPSIGNYFNTDGMLRFNTIEELQPIIESLSKDLYDSMLPGALKNLSIINEKNT